MWFSAAVAGELLTAAAVQLRAKSERQSSLCVTLLLKVMIGVTFSLRIAAGGAG